MRILFLNTGGILGGAERSLLDLLASLRQAEPDLDLHLAVSAEGPLLERVRCLGVQTRILPMPEALARTGDSGLRHASRLRSRLGLLLQAPATAIRTCGYLSRLRQLIAEVRPDVIHSNSIKFHLLTGLASPRSVTVVWHIRDFLSLRPLVARGLRWARRRHGAVAISQAVGEDARSVLPGLPVEVVPNAVDTDYFSPGEQEGAWLDELAGLGRSKGKKEQETGCPLPFSPASSPVRVGLLATYARWKGQEVFLDAVHRLKEQLPEGMARFYVIGGPLYQTQGSQWSEEELRTRGAGLDRTGWVGFVGFQDDPARVYRSLDVVVHASTLPEPFGRTIVEAMACARAVVVARAGGAAELFTQDHDALGVEPGNATELAQALHALIMNPSRRQRLARAARATAVARFSRTRLAAGVLAAYRTFANTGRHQPSHPFSPNQEPVVSQDQAWGGLRGDQP